jgi:enoyl-CoA hydratase
MEFIKVERPSKAVVIVTINRPDALNALTPQMIDAIGLTFNKLKEDADIRAVIFTGAGQKAFSAGVDLMKAGNVFSDQSHLRGNDPRAAIESFPWPVICAVNGFAITGGFELVLACDIIIASSNAKFADTHAKFGIAPSWGLSQKLSRTIGISRAKEMHFTARFVEAEEALKWGLVNTVVAPDQLMAHCLNLANQIATMIPHMLKRYKRTVDVGYGLPYAQAAEMEIKDAVEYYKTMTPEQFKMMQDFIGSRSKTKFNGNSKL